jgi:hypothetical protein
MAYARTLKSGDGATTDFVFSFPYLAKDHVKVFVDGNLETDWTFFAADTIRFITAPANGAVILITRQTSPNVRLVDYSVASSLNEEDLDNDSLQAFYLAQEAIDASREPLTVSDVDGQFDGRGLQIKNVAQPTDPDDVVVLSYLDVWVAQVEAARDAAQVAQGLSEDAQDAAEQAEVDALGASDLAERWATELEDVEVVPGGYSAFHWAEKAYQSAAAAALFDPSSFASVSHTHPQSDITDLESDLSVKASLSGTETLENKTLTAPVINGAVTGGSIATTAEAEAGTGNDQIMTPLRVEEHMEANALGWGQTWQNVAGSRAHSTSYQNTTGRPIQVSIAAFGAIPRIFQVSTDNATWVDVAVTGRSVSGTNIAWNINANIPDGHYYRINGSATVAAWAELR